MDGVNGFVSVTGDDENDIMACMTAKEQGAQRVLALVQQPHYLPLLARIPRLDGAVSRHLTVVSNILRLIRRGNIVSVASLHGIEAEVIEIVAGVNAKIVHKELTSFKTTFLRTPSSVPSFDAKDSLFRPDSLLSNLRIA